MEEIIEEYGMCFFYALVFVFIVILCMTCMRAGGVLHDMVLGYMYSLTG